MWLTAGLVASVLATGCGKRTQDELISSARGYAAKGDHAAAVIQLKNALQRNPSSPEARRLLGEELLEVRDAASAEKELRRALDLKADENRVVPALARALLESRQPDVLIKEFGERAFSDSAVQSRVRTYVGDAYLAAGDPVRAAKAYESVLNTTPDYAPARIGQARLALTEGRTGDAIEIADSVLKSAPNLVDAMVTKADAVLVRGDHDGARSLWRQALQSDPKALAAHFGLILLAIREGKFDEASAQIEAARPFAQRDLRLVYFEALLAYRQGDMNKARDRTLQILKVAPEHVPTLVLAGAVDLRTTQVASAEDKLRRALATAPSNVDARRLLVTALLQSRQPARALDVLQPLLSDAAEHPPAVLLLAGEAYLASGELDKASTYFDQAARIDGQDVAARIRLGQIALAQGRAEEGIQELEGAAGAEANDIRADVALVMGHLRRRDVPKALAAARALARKQPKNPVSFQILASVQLLQKDTGGARASFEQALAVAPSFLPAAVGLANLDVAENKVDTARRRLADLLERDPKNEQILLAQADIQARTGAPANQVRAILEKAVQANPQSPTARLALVSHYLRNKDLRAALAAAQEATSVLPRDARVLEMLAVTQEATGDTGLAADTQNRVVQLRPGSPEPLLHLAALYTRTGNRDGAIEALQRAQKAAPDNRQIDRDLIALLVSQGKIEQALRHARNLQERAPKFAGGFVFEGDVLLLQNKAAEAERAYRAALKVEPTSGQAASKVAMALYAGGRTAEGNGFARKWLTDNPPDPFMRLLLADRALGVRDLPKAAELYKAVLARDSNNVTALNNLAWIGGETGDANAVSYAERAARLAPRNASVLETLGTLLVKDGESARGLELLVRACALAPARLDLRLSHARALVAAGQKDAARKELRELAEGKDDSTEKRAAAELLQKL